MALVKFTKPAAKKTVTYNPTKGIVRFTGGKNTVRYEPPEPYRPPNLPLGTDQPTLPISQPPQDKRQGYYTWDKYQDRADTFVAKNPWLEKALLAIGNWTKKGNWLEGYGRYGATAGDTFRRAYQAELAERARLAVQLQNYNIPYGAPQFPKTGININGMYFDPYGDPRFPKYSLPTRISQLSPLANFPGIFDGPAPQSLGMPANKKDGRFRDGGLKDKGAGYDDGYGYGGYGGWSYGGGGGSVSTYSPNDWLTRLVNWKI